MEEIATLGEWIRRRRKALDLTQDELAHRVSCATITIKKIEADERRPSKQVAERIADCLDIPPDRRKEFVKCARGQTSIIRFLPPALPGDALPNRFVATAKTNLPIQTTVRVGADHNIALVAGKLREPQVRLLTLIGPGGVGKTRLAVDVGAQMMPSFPDGVFFVSLASVRDPALLISEIAQLFGLRESPNEILPQKLVTLLHDKRLLLILDNFEHLLPATLSVADLLSKTVSLKVLATSREVLNISGEHVFNVKTLSLPPINTPASELAKYDASQLFMVRAQSVDFNFNISNATAKQVIEICHYLDGLPLAIELAVAHVAHLPIGKLLTLLKSSTGRLALLTAGPRDWHERQRTLRNTIEWSYQLLNQDEQKLFVRLSIFAGGCTLEAAEQVCSVAADLPNIRLDMFSLLRKSLLKQDDVNGEPRFSMLENIREYSWERLQRCGESFQLYQSLILYYLSLVEDMEPPLVPSIETLYVRLDPELDNLRTVLAWSLNNKEADHSAAGLGIRLAGRLVYFWFHRGLLNEGRHWLTLAARAASSPDIGRARVLNGLGLIAWQQGDYTTAADILEESITLWRSIAYRLGLAEGLHILGHVRFEQREYRLASDLFTESHALYAEMNEVIATLPLVSDLGMVAYHQHDYSSARSLFEEALGLCREYGNKEGILDTTSRLGDLMRVSGNYEQAAQFYEESLALSQELRSNLGIASAKHKLGCVAKASGNPKYAKSLFGESLAIQDEAGNKQGIIECLAGLAGVVEGFEQSAILLGAVEALLDTIGTPLAPADYLEYERDRDHVCSQLGIERFAALCEQGKSMTLLQAIIYAKN